ncbi:hypothetical protein KFK09_028257 [Dendrobium nobile]|uniref:Uncharacterized protein n=1 Tax=Dendrobium nobile TaxID=94219 RepID=A0A8T3A262_DENNO|nr:hypothetical protein KFK09_028257 [Dendrobium nobile]
MATLRSNGRNSIGIVIKEGAIHNRRTTSVKGKGKSVLIENNVGKDYFVGNMNPGAAITESSASDNLILRVNNFSGVLDTLKGRKIGDELISVEGLKENVQVEEGCDVVENLKNKTNEVSEAWSKPKPIKLSFNKNMVERSEDGIAVKLNSDMELKNSQVLKISVVIKVLGNNVPFSVCSTELRKQWGKFGSIHFTSIGMDWILCSFQSSEAVDEVLNGGPWYINGFIVGMDRWTAAFDPNSLKGISAPVWVRFPCLPLYCWDEDNIARIASCLGTPMYVDGNTFRWSKREFVRVCVRIDLEKKLMNGVWVDGSAGRFFQRVEYEKMELLCYQCGRVGHKKELCPDNVLIGIQNQSLKEKEAGIEVGEEKMQKSNSSVTSFEYGPWIHVHFKNRAFNRGNFGRKNLKENRPDESFKNDLGKNKNEELDKKILVNKKTADDAKSVLVPDKIDELEKSLIQEKMETIVTNRFAVLNEDPEEICMVEQIKDQKNIEEDCGINKNCLDASSNATKVKLVKELKSLGPVKVEHKKKKRGARKKEASLYLKEIVRDHSIYFIGLMETKLANIDRKFIDYFMGKDWDYYHYPAMGTSGGIMVLWNKNMVSFDVREPSSQLIEEKRGGKRFLLSKGPKDMKSFMHLARVASDHSPIVLNMKDKIGGKEKVFKFEDTWRSYPAAKNIVYNSWKKKDYANDANWNTNDLVLLRNKIHELNVTLRRLSTWWNQRAKVKWHEEGDANSRFFHNFASARYNGNRINQIRDESNTTQVEEDQIEMVFTKFFEKKWQHRTCELSGWPIIEEIQKVHVEDLAMLNMEFSFQELQISVFQQGNNKSPGIDGVTCSFYKSYWSIVGDVLWNAVNHFFKSGILSKGWKDTLITLISKVKYPLIPSNYRPISLCQTNYKIVATMLVNRLKRIIDKMVYEEQAAFIPGRSISEHCLLAHEIFHKFRLSKNKKGLMAIKLDMEQAYDSMGWSTLHQVLEWYGFPTSFSNCIMECVVDTRFSIIINVKKSNWICAKSGFRQGCPLSPYLFILCSQLLSNSLEQRGKDLGICISPRGPKISHLLYADDVLILAHVSIILAKKVKKIVEEFCNWTGQRANVNKSQILFGKMVNYPLKKKITKIIGFKEIKEMKYLGIKISLRRSKITDFQDLLSMVMDKLNSWSKKSLSMGGKITLIESSLLYMPNFLITNSLVPKRVLYEIEKLCRSFLWHKNDGIKGMHYVGWNEICKPKCLGGLGLQSPLLRIGSLRSSLAWNFIQKQDSLLHKTLTSKYGDIMSDDHKVISSSAWKILWDGAKNLKNVIRWKVGKGNKISILNDAWLLDKSINRWPTYVDCIALEGKYIQQLHLPNGNWNSDMLGMAFHPELIALIVQVQIRITDEDKMELVKWCSGKTVAALVYEQILIDNFNFSDVDYFKWLWKLKLNKKVEIFWWRLGKAAIPTNLYLKNHRISLIDGCERGCQAVESYEHIMVHCKHMVEIIMKIRDLGIMIPVFNSLDECLIGLKKLSISNPGIAKAYCSVIYLSWKNRNYVKHGKEAIPPSMVASNALYLAVSKSSPYLSSWGTNLLRESSNTWCPPPKDWIKINLDASLLTSYLGGIGGVVRDHRGRLISAFGKKKIHWDVTQLELEAIITLKNFLQSWMLECKGMIIESDNVNIIRFIQKFLKKNNWPLGDANEQLIEVLCLLEKKVKGVRFSARFRRKEMESILYHTGLMESIFCEKKKKKMVALKANDSDTDSSGSESDDVALIMRQFKSFLRNKHKNNQRWNKGKGSKNFKNFNDIIYFKYWKPGHVKADCPTLKAHSSKKKREEKPNFKKDKNKKRFHKAFRADSTSNSSETEAEKEITNLCLMVDNHLCQSDQDKIDGAINHEVQQAKEDWGDVQVCESAVLGICKTVEGLDYVIPPQLRKPVVFGDSALYHIIRLELRRQWNQYGRFHMTLLGGGWVLCAFEDPEATDSLLNIGPWYVNGSIIRLDKWSPDFHPSSLKGLMALVWIRLPNLLCKAGIKSIYVGLLRRLNKWTRKADTERKLINDGVINDGVGSQAEKDGEIFGINRTSLKNADSRGGEKHVEVTPVPSANDEDIQAVYSEVNKKVMGIDSDDNLCNLNQYKVLNKLGEEGEIICNIYEATDFTKAPCSISVSRENVESLENESKEARFNHSEEGSNKVRKKGSKQLKGLGPIKLIPRNRKLKGEDKSLLNWPTFVNPLEGSNLSVDKFISNGVWNINELQNFFGEELVNMSTSIQIQAVIGEDRMELIHNVSGKTIAALASEAVEPNNSE